MILNRGVRILFLLTTNFRREQKTEERNRWLALTKDHGRKGRFASLQLGRDRANLQVNPAKNRNTTKPHPGRVRQDDGLLKVGNWQWLGSMATLATRNGVCRPL